MEPPAVSQMAPGEPHVKNRGGGGDAWVLARGFVRANLWIE
jgi:hypothetical protein